MSAYIHTGRTDHGIAAQRGNGARHKGKKRPASMREKMRVLAASRGMPDHLKLVSQRAKAKGVQLAQRGIPQREAARQAGISLGALQRALRQAQKA